MVQASESSRPLAVYTDNEDLNVSAGVRILEDAGFEVRLLETLDRSAIIAGAVDAVALLVSYAEIDEKVIAALPNLKIIALMSMGVNNIDVSAASSRGIWVTNVGSVATEEVATHTLALALHMIRGIGHYQHSVRKGDWTARLETQPLRSSNLTLGIVGLGRIGRKVAELARPFFGETVGYDPFFPEDDSTRPILSSLGVRRVELDELQHTSDMVTLHIPATPDTERLVDAEFLANMSPQSYLINVSRGSLVDSFALCASLDSGHISGAALDVLEEEPPAPNHPLRRHPRAVITPHIAYYSGYTEDQYVKIQAENVAKWRATGVPTNPV